MSIMQFLGAQVDSGTAARFSRVADEEAKVGLGRLAIYIYICINHNANLALWAPCWSRPSVKMTSAVAVASKIFLLTQDRTRTLEIH